MSRILSMNEHYIKNINEGDLFDQLKTYCEIYKKKFDIKKEEEVKKSLNFLKNKAKTLEDIYNNAKYLISDELKINDEDLKLIDDKAKKIINEFSKNINESSQFTKEKLEEILNQLIKKHQTNFKGVGQPMRIALIGSKFGPGIFDIILSLGKETVIKRLSKFN
jgi:glutamyl-tRNA synthetase